MRPAKRSQLGSIEKRGRKYRARYMRFGQYHEAGKMFNTMQLADRWLLDEERLIERDEWTPPAKRRAEAQAKAKGDEVTLKAYGLEWIANRTKSDGKPLAASTKKLYKGYLANQLKELAEQPLAAISAEQVSQWWISHGQHLKARKEAYSLMSSIYKSALKAEYVKANPCQVENANARVRLTSPQERGLLIAEISPLEMVEIVEAYDRDHFRLALKFCAWCGLRIGEALALTRDDIKAKQIEGLTQFSLYVTKTVSDGEDGRVVKEPKTQESIRRVLVPPHLNEAIRQHIATIEPGALLFPSTNPAMPYATNEQVRGSDNPGRYTGWLKVRQIMNRPRLRIHDLRHWARMMWTRAGLDYPSVEMMLGHKLPEVVGIYAHFDPVHVWPYAIKVSQLAGWSHDTPKELDGKKI